MKARYLKRILTVSFAATVLLFSSCLKDDTRLFEPESVTPNLAELPYGGLIAANFKNSIVVPKTTGLTTVTFAVGVTSKDLPTSPTTITIAIDAATIAAYNTTYTKTYIAVPGAALAATKITIPAGQNSVLTTLTFDGTTLDATKSYMIPVKITDAGGLPISANFGINYFHIR